MSSKELPDRVESDPMLNGHEKETTITMCGMDKEFCIFSAKATVVKSLLDHDYFSLEWAEVIEGSTRYYVETRSELESSNGSIVGVEGKMPVGALTVKSKPRTNNHQSSIVNSETIDPSVFE